MNSIRSNRKTLFTSITRCAVAWVCVSTLALTATAQDRPAATNTPLRLVQQPPAAAAADSDETRPATTTWLGDTGLWLVPSAEILRAGGWSVAGNRTNIDFDQGFSDVTHVPFSVAVGLADRAEIFGAFQALTRIDRDTRPLFSGLASPESVGGVVNEYPLVRQGWSGNQVGDLFVGAKINLLSEHRQEPLALAVRGVAKLPTGDEDSGAGTGKADWMFDGIVSKEIAEAVELSGFGGVIVRGDPDGFDLSNGFRWGVGAGFPSRSRLRVTAELSGESAFDDVVTLTRTLTGTDGSIAPTLSKSDGVVNASVGLTYQARSGFFLGVAGNYMVLVNPRSDHRAGISDVTGDAMDVLFRIGFHPGTRIYVPPPPPPPPPPAPAPPPANSAPTVSAACDPCSVQVGQPSTLTATANDPDGDPIAYTWRAPSGTLSDAAARQTRWTAPDQPGSVPVTVTVSDGRGGTASDTVTLEVTPAPVRDITFEDVHFDFDRYTLRPAATRVLNEAVETLRAEPSLRITIEGHTCNIGTAEYNLALGDRRANAVRDYLTSQGIAAARLQTVSYGEERPRHDNSREETRRLNRRAALVVRIEPGP